MLLKKNCIIFQNCFEFESSKRFLLSSFFFDDRRDVMDVTSSKMCRPQSLKTFLRYSIDHSTIYFCALFITHISTVYFSLHLCN